MVKTHVAGGPEGGLRIVWKIGISNSLGGLGVTLQLDIRGGNKILERGGGRVTFKY